MPSMPLTPFSGQPPTTTNDLILKKSFPRKGGIVILRTDTLPYLEPVTLKTTQIFLLDTIKGNK